MISGIFQMSLRWAGLLCGIWLCGVSHRLLAQTSAKEAPQPAADQSPPAGAVRDAETFHKQVRPFLTAHCIKCHGPKKAEGKLRLDTLAADFVTRAAADQWIEVLNRVNLGEMPPKDESQPPAADLERVTDWITAELSLSRQRAQSSGGRVLLRRLTRFEYANTVRSLLDVDFVEGESPLERLPPDGSLAGFDRVSKALLLDPSLMEAYLTVGQEVASRAVVFRPPLTSQRTLRFSYATMPDTAMAYQLNSREMALDGGLVVVMEGAARAYAKLRHPFNNQEIPVTGKYRVRVRAAADRGQRGEPIYLDVSYGAAGRQARFRVDAPRNEPAIYEFEKTFDAFEPGEFQVGLVNGVKFRAGNAEWYYLNGELTKLAEQGNSREATRIKARLRAEGGYDQTARGSYLSPVLHTETLPKLYLDWIELIGPIQGEHPPQSLKTVFGDMETARRFIDPLASREQVLALTRELLTRLVPRAFRRPAKAGEVEALVKLVAAELQAGADPPQALRAGLTALLCAPDFLFLFEPAAPDAQAPRKLNDFELAARLSYFLWSGPPDAELARLAAAGQLHQPRTLSAQVDRLLGDPRSEALVQSFARQWLKVDEISRFAPDQQIYPDYYATDMAGVERDVKLEPLAFFREVLQRDESVGQFLDSDWLMLNERLAKLYGIPGVEGPALRRVALNRGKDSPAAQGVYSSAHCRGGLLGMAGVHLWGADGNRTKPVERGKYVLTVMFNNPPPPPPPNAGEVEPNLGGQILSVRQRLAKHRAQTTCNNCHRRIDPFGLALENFNAIGRWRDQMDGEKPLAHWGDNRPAIDPSGALPNGRVFKDFVSFKQALVEQQDRFVRALGEKLFIYALGRTLEPEERSTLEQVAAKTRSRKPTLRALIQEIVAAEAFQTK